MSVNDLEATYHDRAVEIKALRAENERLRAENREYQAIRDLCVKALMLVTGCSKEAVEEAPRTCAKRTADEIKRLRAIEVTLRTQIHQERNEANAEAKP